MTDEFSGYRSGNYPKAFKALFGRTKQQIEVSSFKTSSPNEQQVETGDMTEASRTVLDQDASLVDLDQVMNSLPDPPSQNFYSPQAEELSCKDDSFTESRTDTVGTQIKSDASGACSRSSVSMKGRKLPPIPGSHFQPVPKKVSDEVVKQDHKRTKKPREVRIVEKDLKGLFKEFHSRV